LVKVNRVLSSTPLLALTAKYGGNADIAGAIYLSGPAVSQQRPCHSDYLPLSLGDTGFFQAVGFASFAGQTKKGQRMPFSLSAENIKS